MLPSDRGRRWRWHWAMEQRQARRRQPAALRLNARARRVSLHRLRVADAFQTCGEITQILFMNCLSPLVALSFPLAICAAANVRGGCMRAASVRLNGGLPDLVREWRVHVSCRVSEKNDAGM